jgi:hypothetical protein
MPKTINYSSRLHLFVITSLLFSTLSSTTAIAKDIQESPKISSRATTNQKSLLNWFNSYDSIRRKAQLSPTERSEADALLDKGLSILTAGPDKDAAQALLQKMVNNYKIASNSMQELPVLSETQALHQGYYQYFTTAANLFNDYLTVQNNFFATDSQGKPVIQGLLARKEELENLNNSIQSIDEQTRAQFNIPPYQY